MDVDGAGGGGQEKGGGVQGSVRGLVVMERTDHIFPAAVSGLKSGKRQCSIEKD